jgi:hypothetical protein
MISEIEGGKNFLTAGSILASNPEIFEKAKALLKE